MAETGLRQMTVTLEAGTVTDIVYPRYTAVDIMNGTEGVLYVNDTGEFDNGEYFSIPAGGGYNGYRPAMDGSATVYLKAAVAGEVSLVMTRY